MAASSLAVYNAYNALGSYTTGKVTPNTIYAYAQDSAAHITWQKLGRIAIITIWGIQLRPGFSTDNLAIIASGLPAAIKNIEGAIPINVNNANQTRYTLYVDTSGILKAWYNGTTVTDTDLRGQFVYISKD
ncbi:MAG: hypothetical protein ACRDBO_02070 [Lachnospiraceae bacterium]